MLKGFLGLTLARGSGSKVFEEGVLIEGEKEDKFLNMKLDTTNNRWILSIKYLIFKNKLEEENLFLWILEAMNVDRDGQK